MNIKLLFHLRKLIKQNRLGDVAIVKAEAFGIHTSSKLRKCLKNVTGYFPEVDLDTLEDLSDNTFGNIYSHYMKKNKLTPFVVSQEYYDMANNNVFACRYAITHDIFHLLLDFDTSYAGEIGVLAFAAAQGYSNSLKYLALPLAFILYPIFSPKTIRQIYANAGRGWRMGKKAKFLLGIRFEEMWERPFDEMKLALGLPE